MRDPPVPTRTQGHPMVLRDHFRFDHEPCGTSRDRLRLKQFHGDGEEGDPTGAQGGGPTIGHSWRRSSSWYSVRYRRD